METKLSVKDKKAKQRYDDEVKLRADINKLLWEFSKKYDVECVDIGIARNEWYGRNTYECPMYLLSLAWKFDYLAHEKD